MVHSNLSVHINPLRLLLLLLMLMLMMTIRLVILIDPFRYCPSTQQAELFSTSNNFFLCVSLSVWRNRSVITTNQWAPLRAKPTPSCSRCQVHEVSASECSRSNLGAQTAAVLAVVAEVLYYNNRELRLRQLCNYNNNEKYELRAITLASMILLANSQQKSKTNWRREASS